MNEDSASSTDTSSGCEAADDASPSGLDIETEVGFDDPLWAELGIDVEALAGAAIGEALAVIGARGRAIEAGRRVEVSVLFTDNENMRELNAGYRNRDEATNVLAFPLASAAHDMDAETGGNAETPLVLGDVVLARETICAEAASEGKDLSDHLSHLIVHGALHLLGFDHGDDEEARTMERLESEILVRLGVADPHREERAAAS